MKKLLILFSVVILATLGIYFYNANPTYEKRALITDLKPLKCDLNKQNCKVDYKGKKVEFILEPKPIQVLKETKLIIKNLDEIPNLNAKLYGLNMYMGDIISEFERQNNTYTSTIVLSVCTQNLMRYRLELFSGEKSLNLFVDFDVRR